MVDLSLNIYGSQNHPRYLFALLKQFITCESFESEYLEIWLSLERGKKNISLCFSVLKGTLFELHGLGPNRTPLQIYTHINIIKQKGVIFSIRLHAEPLLKVIRDLYRVRYNHDSAGLTLI